MIAFGRPVRLRRLMWLALAALAAIVLAGIIWAGVGEQPPPPPMPITLHNGKFVGHRFVSKAWSLDYTKIVTSPDGTTFAVDGINAGLLFKAGQPYLRFRAAHVSGNTVTLDLSAVGPVHVESINGPIKRSFDTDAIEWQNAAQRLEIPHLSTLRSDTDVLHVSRVTVNFKTGAITLKGVRGDVR